MLEDPATCDHEWMVYSTVLNEGWLELHCDKCALVGTVIDPSKEEWQQAFSAPSEPYQWHDNSRVKLGTFQMI